MAAPLPWFPLYIDAFEMDEHVRHMSDECLGIYVRLLCWQWREGSVPAAYRDAARLLHARARAVRVVYAHFFLVEDPTSGRAINPKLAQVYTEQVAKSDKAKARAVAYRDRMRTERVPNAHATVASQDRSRERIRSRIRESLSAHAANDNGHGGIA